MVVVITVNNNHLCMVELRKNTVKQFVDGTFFNEPNTVIYLRKENIKIRDQFIMFKV